MGNTILARCAQNVWDANRWNFCALSIDVVFTDVMDGRTCGEYWSKTHDWTIGEIAELAKRPVPGEPGWIDPADRVDPDGDFPLPLYIGIGIVSLVLGVGVYLVSL